MPLRRGVTDAQRNCSRRAFLLLRGLCPLTHVLGLWALRRLPDRFERPGGFCALGAHPFDVRGPDIRRLEVAAHNSLGASLVTLAAAASCSLWEWQRLPPQRSNLRLQGGSKWARSSRPLRLLAV